MANLLKSGFKEVRVESGAGRAASYDDEDYRKAGKEGSCYLFSPHPSLHATVNII